MKKKPSPMTHRHGDVGIQSCAAPPVKGRQKVKHLTLADGELTGHSHRVVGLDGSALTNKDAELVLSADGQLFLRAKTKVAVIHQEHARIELEPGWHRIIQQREWAPEGERRVLD